MKNLIQTVIPNEPTAMLLLSNLKDAGATQHRSKIERDDMRRRVSTLGDKVWGRSSADVPSAPRIELSFRAHAVLLAVLFALKFAREPLPLRPILEYLEGPVQFWYGLDGVLRELTDAGLIDLEQHADGVVMCRLGRLSREELQH